MNVLVGFLHLFELRAGAAVREADAIEAKGFLGRPVVEITAISEDRALLGFFRVLGEIVGEQGVLGIEADLFRRERAAEDRRTPERAVEFPVGLGRPTLLCRQDSVVCQSEIL